MLMSASPEFLALCRSQVALLTQGFGAALSIVYLAEGTTEEATADLVPIVAYPEAAASWEREQVLSLLTSTLQEVAEPRSLTAHQFLVEESPLLLPSSQEAGTVSSSSPNADAALDQSMMHEQQMVLPLMHEGLVMGLLVTARVDRPWLESERSQIERIARSLALACVMDQRWNWAEHDLAALQQLQSQQSDLFDNLLHQFRNPLTALKTFGKLLIKRLSPTDKNREVAESIVRESEHLQELLRQFEQVTQLQAERRLGSAASSALDAGSATLEANDQRLLSGANALTAIPLTLSWHRFDEVLEPLLESELAIAQERRIRLIATIPPQLPNVQVDMAALREVLNNLLDNAIKYTPSGGQVTVLLGLHRTLGTRDQQGIAIVDNGPGIPHEDLPRLFERHFRGVQANSAIPGTGLGLAIARQLVAQMGGDIQVFSPAHESGLTRSTQPPGAAFVVWLNEESGARS
ncbi:GAF domain-containing sensor histidine kinase [Leptolyngbya sp. AN02str]|uniref:GAF domain-containing sensor histidine kinase n=1 Tax=Leptolyngbya sp. AN02str TaxID=3423363 RepID=UPI003D31C0B1